MDIDGLDFPRFGATDSNQGTVVVQNGKEPLPLQGCQFLGILKNLIFAIWWQDHTGRHNRAGKRSSTGFIEASNQCCFLAQ